MLNYVYWQVLDLLEAVFVAIFDGINEKCAKHLEAINAQYPFEPLQVGVLFMCLLRILISTA
jgi:aspartyl-tRNA synthetase